jgi:enterochelin esterase-like enzyme
VLEPQGTLFFLLLMVAFGALVVWLVLTKQVVFRVFAACLAFIPAMVFGIAAVNKYYDYYQTWGAMFSDLSGQAQSIPHVSAASLKRGAAGSLQQQIASSSNPSLDAQFGDLFSTTVTGPSSHITRQVYIYLPPQYFSTAYAKYRFPVIELLHGAPGQPATWVNVMNVIPIYLGLLGEHKAAPAVLVMPDTDGGLQYSLQCLNDPHGLQDMTFVAKEVPNWVAANLRVQPPSGFWGVAGYSEGGFCAANIGLQYATRFGYVGVESGYFAPDTSQVPLGGKPNGKPHDVNVFKGNPRLLALNTPQEYIKHIPVGTTVPQFFFAAGAEDQGDVDAAEYFRQLLLLRVADVPPVDIVNGAGHQALVWRTALTPILEWMTSGLATEIQREGAENGPKPAATHSAKPAHKLPLKTAHLPLPRPTTLSPSRTILSTGRYPAVGAWPPHGFRPLPDSSRTKSPIWSISAG